MKRLAGKAPAKPRRGKAKKLPPLQGPVTSADFLKTRSHRRIQRTGRPKRKATPAQLAALARGRRTRMENLRRGQGYLPLAG